MKAVRIHQLGGPEGLKFDEAAEPRPARGQVAVRMRAASLNYRDLMILSGAYPAPVALPLVPLSDGAGEVAAVGEGVTRWKPRDRVAGTFFQRWTTGPLRPQAFGSALGGAIDGLLAEVVTLSEDGVVAAPEHLSFEEAATLPCAALTAWNALVTSGKVSAGQTVLLLGTGGVSVFALQFAKMHGARAIVTSSSDEKLARARALGADETINYRAIPDWDEEVLRRTDGAGVDHVVEVGGVGTFPKSLNALALGGTISVIGGVAGFGGAAPVGAVLGKGALVRGVYVGSREMFEAMNRAIEVNRLKPVVDRAFPFSEAADAYRCLQGAGHFGKVVITDFGPAA